MNNKAFRSAGRLAVVLAAAIALAGCAFEPAQQPPPAKPAGAVVSPAVPAEAAVPGLQPPQGAPAAGVASRGQAAPSPAEAAPPGASALAPAAQLPASAATQLPAPAAAQPPAPAAVLPGPVPQAAGPETTQQSPPSAVSGAVEQQPPAKLPAAQTEPAAGEVKPAVQISITGDKETGTILESTAVEFKEGDSVFDVLQRITKQKKIQMEYRGSSKSAYIEGIANLYEFDKGGKSGWLYRVNGTFPNKSAGAYILQKGDRIEWVYTLDLGKDAGKTDNPKAGATPDTRGGGRMP